MEVVSGSALIAGPVSTHRTEHILPEAHLRGPDISSPELVSNHLHRDHHCPHCASQSTSDCDDSFIDSCGYIPDTITGERDSTNSQLLCQRGGGPAKNKTNETNMKYYLCYS
ncbi:hypothetical protein KOW79_019185 [Hemibagrus wyckioides]|uniref:Uncharacterized protein n=1 Tax=Hemibagrus wyckioides TaxID=337641 RepID=A0A9D3N747_9TELE|nr:hypothetical protein KOW79_019185 [Hemibagrus wyckioides]